MAMNLDAILRIAARVSGQQEVRSLGRDVEGVGRAADRSVGGVGRLSVGLGGLRSVAAALGFTGLIAGLTAFGVKIVDTGEKSNLLERRLESVAGPMGETQRVMDFATASANKFSMSQLQAATAATDLYARMRPLGLSVGQIESTFIGVTKAVRLAGLSGFDAKEAFRQLGQAMGSGRLQGDEFRSLMERIPILGVKITEVFNRLRSEGGLILITRQEADGMVKEVKEGERRQTEAIKEGIRQRKEALEKGGDDELLRIARHYERIRRITEDSNADQDTAEERARNKRMDETRKAVEDRYEDLRKSLDREYEDRLSRISDDESISDERKKILRREIQDEQDQRREGLQARQDAEIEAIQGTEERAATLRKRQLRDQRTEQEQALADRQRIEENAVRQGLEQQKRDLDASLEQTVKQNEEANKRIIAGILSRVEVTQGELKKMASEGLIDPQVMQMALAEMAKLNIPEPTAIMKFNAAFENLTLTLGEKLLPKLTPLIERLTQLLSDPGFQQSLSDLIRNLAEVVVPLIKPLIEVLNGVIQAFGALPPGLRDAIVKTAVLIGLLKGLGAIGVLGGLARLAGWFGKIATAAGGAGRAIQRVNVRDLTNSLPGGGQPLLRGTTFGPVPPIKPPSTSFWQSFLSGLNNVKTGMGGLLKQIMFLGRYIISDLSMAIPIFGRLGQAIANLRIGATVTGWLTAMTPFAGRAIALLTPLLTWVTGTMLPTLVGVFSGPAGWIALGVAALALAAYTWREPIWRFVEWATDQFLGFWQKVIDFFYQQYLEPWVNLWNSDLVAPIRDSIPSMVEAAGALWDGIEIIGKEWLDSVWKSFWENETIKAINSAVKSWSSNINKTFNNIMNFLSQDWLAKWNEFWPVVVSNLHNRLMAIPDALANAFKSASGVIQAVYDNLAQGVVRAWNWMAGGVHNIFNGVVDMYNEVVRIVNRLPGVNIPLAGRITTAMTQQAPVSAFATGGFVTRPTLGWVGEGRLGGEYMIPTDQMTSAMAGWAQGLRGQSLVAYSRSSPSGPPRASAGGRGGAEIRISINQNGPILQTPDGQDWITREEAIGMLRDGMRQVASSNLEAVASLMRSPTARSTWGLR